MIEGSKVRIRKDSSYYNNNTFHDPRCNGTVMRSGAVVIKVKWDNSAINIYINEDLEIVNIKKIFNYVI